jgi:hypothetical protein
MDSITNPVVTYRQIRLAFSRNHEAVMEKAQKDAFNASQDPIEAAVTAISPLL